MAPATAGDLPRRGRVVLDDAGEPAQVLAVAPGQRHPGLGAVPPVAAQLHRLLDAPLHLAERPEQLLDLGRLAHQLDDEVGEGDPHWPARPGSQTLRTSKIPR